jgi:maltose O-acetyltransferase
MKTEKEKMLAGELYDALDDQLTKDRLKTRLLIKQLNDSWEDQTEDRMRILKELMPKAGEGLLASATLLLRLWV